MLKPFTALSSTFYSTNILHDYLDFIKLFSKSVSSQVVRLTSTKLFFSCAIKRDRDDALWKC